MSVLLRRVDLFAALAGVLAAVMAGVYVGLVREQGNPPAVWFLVGLLAGSLACGYGANARARHRRRVLVVAGVGLLLLGMLAILTIGLPILVAGLLALLAGPTSPPSGTLATRQGKGSVSR